MIGAGDLSDEKYPNIIGRMGGKSKLAKTIISLFPPDDYIKTYVELFVGGGSIFFKKKEAQINVINDLDKDIFDIYNDFKNVDSIENFNFDPLKEKYIKLQKSNPTNTKERLYRNLYISKNSYQRNRRSFAIRGSKNTGRNIKKHFIEIKSKLQNTTILNLDYKKVIKKYNKKDTLFYLDPPYSEQKSTWGYKEGKNITPEELLNELKKIKGYFLMSYDYSPTLKKLFEEFFVVKVVNTKYELKKGTINKKELIIMNYF